MIQENLNQNDTYEQLKKEWKKEDLQEIKDLKDNLDYFNQLYKKELFSKKTESLNLTFEIIQNLKKLYLKKVNYYNEQYSETR